MDLNKHLYLSQAYVHTGLPQELQNLFLCKTYPYNRLMCIQDSRRSYRTYTYTDLCLFRTPVGVTELVLIQNLCLFRTPIGVTELRLMLQSLNLFEGTRRYHRDYRTCTGIAELILIRKYL